MKEITIPMEDILKITDIEQLKQRLKDAGFDMNKQIHEHYDLLSNEYVYRQC